MFNSACLHIYRVEIFWELSFSYSCSTDVEHVYVYAFIIKIKFYQNGCFQTFH